ncbi:hypothetical protein [Streptomyces sp. NPDC058434]|uniref:hypothetical protein n=1 Tax=Streptomyces sp. NPDC058434 TaxID=3346498 RepID=UPI0036687D9E
MAPVSTVTGGFGEVVRPSAGDGWRTLSTVTGGPVSTRILSEKRSAPLGRPGDASAPPYATETAWAGQGPGSGRGRVAQTKTEPAATAKAVTATAAGRLCRTANTAHLPAG